MLEKYPNLDDWKMNSLLMSYILSNGPDKLDVIRKLGQLYWLDCNIENLPNENNATKREYGCAVVVCVWNFKPDMVLYNAKSSNVKMTYEVYINLILVLLLDNVLRMRMTLYERMVEIFVIELAVILWILR